MTLKIYKLSSALAFFLLATGNLNSQNVSLQTQDQSNKLAFESEVLSAQAETIRSNAAKVDGTGKELMIEEAKSLEKQALLKRIESLSLSYNFQKRKYSDRLPEINNLQSTSKITKNKMHIQFLSDDSNKNAKQAELLYQEGITVSSPAYAVMVLENAQEKILLSVKQQDELIGLLKENRGENYASTK